MVGPHGSAERDLPINVDDVYAALNPSDIKLRGMFTRSRMSLFRHSIEEKKTAYKPSYDSLRHEGDIRLEGEYSRDCKRRRIVLMGLYAHLRSYVSSIYSEKDSIDVGVFALIMVNS